jgi:hypothetical protein
LKISNTELLHERIGFYEVLALPVDGFASLPEHIQLMAYYALFKAPLLFP